MLKDLTLDSAGTYKCEVSGEAPSFRTKSAMQVKKVARALSPRADSNIILFPRFFQDMVVVVPPSKAEIVGAQPKYQVGDIVNVTCYSYR